MGDGGLGRLMDQQLQQLKALTFPREIAQEMLARDCLFHLDIEQMPQNVALSDIAKSIVSLFNLDGNTRLASCREVSLKDINWTYQITPTVKEMLSMSLVEAMTYFLEQSAYGAFRSPVIDKPSDIIIYGEDGGLQQGLSFQFTNINGVEFAISYGRELLHLTAGVSNEARISGYLLAQYAANFIARAEHYRKGGEYESIANIWSYDAVLNYFPQTIETVH